MPTARYEAEVTTMVHLSGDDTEDAARWWRAYQLADNNQVDDSSVGGLGGIEVLRMVADLGDDSADLHALPYLTKQITSMPDDACGQNGQPQSDHSENLPHVGLDAWRGFCPVLPT